MEIGTSKKSEELSQNMGRSQLARIRMPKADAFGTSQKFW
jgi:hypothetical protein